MYAPKIDAESDLFEQEMKCPKCQFENPDEAKFCLKCGSKLEIACPGCGKPNPPGSKFCMECGHDLAIPPESPSAADLSFEEKLEKIQRYLPGGLTEKILAQRGKIEGERKQVTVMFCDAEGFSLLSERLGHEKVYSIMDEVFETLIHRVIDYGGTVNKMTGDGIMALFGAPIALEDAPQRAIRSALAIQREMTSFSDRTKEETGMPPIRMRIGIHTGPVVVGSLGNDLRVEFTAVGDTVNLASRMEGLAEPGTVYVTEDTFKLTEGLFRFEALGEMQVKGKETPVRAYRVIAPSTRRTRFDVSAERGLTPFLGRERELELLLDGLERARAGRGQAFSVMGEAGVGKSRLLYEFRKAVANEDVIFLEGRCLSYSTNVAYHPVIDLLKSTFDIHEGDDDDRIRDRVKKGLKEQGADESSTLPFVLEMLSVKESGIDAMGLTPEVRKDRTLEALKRIVLKGSERRPLVMAVEDLHWVDKSSEEAFKDMLDAISGAQLLLIFTYRPEFVHTWGRKSYHNQVTLNCLSNRETLAMAAYVLGTEVMGEDLKELILNKTEGIPFFVEEFMKSLKDLGMIEWKDSGYYLAKDIQEVAIPSTIQEVIMARVDSLPEGAKNVLQTGSAIGREFSCELIKRVTGIPTPEMTPHLSVLRDSELLYERGIFPQATYIFRHSLTQEVAYDSLLLKRKQEIHNRVGQAIEELYPDRLDEFYEMLAYHYSRSENLEKAYQYLKLSGEKATQNYSNWEAFGFGKEAINVLNSLPDTQKNKRRGIEIRLLMASMMISILFPEELVPILEEGESLSRELGDDRSLAKFYSYMGLDHSVKGDYRRGMKYAENAFQLAEKVEDNELTAQAGFLLCGCYIWGSEFCKVAEVAPKAISTLERMPAPERVESLGKGNLYVHLCGLYGQIMGNLGNFAEGEALCKKAMRLALETDDPLSLGNAEYTTGMIFNQKGDGQTAAEHFDNAIRYFEQTKNMAMLVLCRGGLSHAQYLLGDLETPLQDIQERLKQYGDVKSPLFAWAHCQLGTIHLDLGHLEDAQSHGEQALKLSQEYKHKFFEAASRMALGRIMGKVDVAQREKAEEYILQGIRISDESKTKPALAEGYLYLGELYADTGQTENALETLKKAEAEFRDMGMDYWLHRTQDVLARVQQ